MYDAMLDEIQDELALTYGFITLRPHNDYTIKGTEHLENFEEVVYRFDKKRYVKEIICEAWESKEKDGVVRDHWHCLFTFNRYCSRSTIHQGLSRGAYGYLFKSKASVDMQKVCEKDKAKVCAYITKDKRKKNA